ncbi:MAG: penicillin-binding protein 1A [Bdellovibrionota bacterium]
MLRRGIKIIFFLGLGSLSLSFISGFVFLFLINKDLPSIESLKNYEPKEASLVFSNQGEVIGEFFEERRIVVKDIPEVIKQAFIAAEDAQFYSHRGIDFWGVLRAAYVNLKAGGIRQGASTITQQVARAFLLSSERTYTRKIKEAILAWKIEQSLSKEQILFLYLNQIYLGHGAYGVASAAQIYFGKKLEDVSLAEAAVLGGLPQAPSRYSPARNPYRVKRRQLYVLRQMLNENFITKAQYESAANEDIYVEPRRDINKTLAPYFVEYIRQYVMNKYGSRMVLEDGLKIYTTLNLDMTRYAQNALRKGLSELEKRQGYKGPLKKLQKSEVEKYFAGRRFEEQEIGSENIQQNLEVDQKETEGRGLIRMKSGPALEVGDFIEGIVVRVDDSKNEVIVEYEPELYARIQLEDLKWAHERISPDDEDQVIKAVTKVSEVLNSGDVIVMTVKALSESAEATEGQDRPYSISIEAALEQDTEVEGALMSVDPRNGFVYSMIGGYDFNRSQFNRAVQARRQPGSSFKPIIYAAALEYGFTPASLLQDSPITFENQLDQERWRPNNYDQKFVGDTTLRSSLLTSRNITTIKLLNSIGLDPIIQKARHLGIDSFLSRDFTLALGSSVVTLEEMIKPYVVFANGGYPQDFVFIKKIMNREGQIIEENVEENFSAPIDEILDHSVGTMLKEVAQVELRKTHDVKEDSDDENASFLKDVVDKDKKQRSEWASRLKAGQVLASETSYLMTHLLKENILYGSGRRARELNRPASGKTGTTDDNRDAWFIGYTPQLVTGVWVGYDNLRRLGRFETGSRAAVPIWLDFMINATAKHPKLDFPVPDNIEFARIDPVTGRLADEKTKGAVFEAFVKGTAPVRSADNSQEVLDFYQSDY